MQVCALTERDTAAWDEFVYHSAEAGVYHLVSWQDIMARTFGHETSYLLARQGSEVRGVLPLLHIRSRLSGHYLTSLSGGMCCQDGEAASALLDQARELLHATRAQYLVLRDSLQKWEAPGLVTNEDHCTLVARLSPEWEQVLKRIKRKERQLTHQGLRAGASVVSGPQQLGAFYPAYSRAMRDKGTPTPGLAFFQNAIDLLPAHMRLMVVRQGEHVLGGGFIAPFRDTVSCAWAGVLRKFYDLRPSHLLYWETMQFGSANGYEWVDFGRSRWNSGTFLFKKSWGGEPRPLYQQYFLNGIERPPAVGGARQDDSRYRLFIRLWQRLPLPVTEALGPRLRKRMPFG